MSSRSSKRRMKGWAKILIAVLIIAIIGGGVYLGYTHRDMFIKKEAPAKKEEEPKEEVKKPKDYSAKLFMVGDSLIHYGVYADARQADGSYDFKPMLEYIKPISSKYDLVYYNQETILGGTEMGLSSYPRFNSPQEVGDAFIDAGFNMVSLATNHTMDKGEEGVLRSVAYWKSKESLGVVTSGQWENEEERESYPVYEKNGIKYGFLAYTTWTNGLETPYGKPYLNNVYDDVKAKYDIEHLRDKVDVIIVAMHWGTEYSFGVNTHQDRIAKYLSDLGVQIIIGAHPHVVESCEYINDGKTFVIYSLGNFLSDQGDIDNQTGLMFELTINKHVDENDNVTISIDDPRAQLSYTKDKRDFRVIPYSKLDNNILPNYMAHYERYKKIVNEFYPDLTWGLTYE